MTRESFAAFLEAGVVAFLLVVLLFADGARALSLSVIGSSLREIAAVLRDPGTQWMVFLCLGIYFTAFLFLRSWAVSGFWRATNPSLWLALGLFIGAIFYAFSYSPSLDALTLLAGAVLGQGLAAWANFEIRNAKPETRNRFGVLVVSLLLILLALASIWRKYTGAYFAYRNHARWSGPWDNPNIFGLLMGVGVTLALGGVVSSFPFSVFSKPEAGSWKLRIKRYAIIILCFLAVVLMGGGLLHSYSRGAWLATFCGFVYLAFQVIKNSHFQQIRTVHWIHTNKVSLVVIICAITVLAFWQFQQPQHPVVRRASSVGNVNDFSWRNRVAAWEGALQMMAEKPWLGFGWNQPEPMYEHYYLPPKSTESAAIRMNDYLMLGATLGIPALFCYATYIWLCLTRSGFRVPSLGGLAPKPRDRGTPNKDCSPTSGSNFGLLTSDFLPAVCRAGAIVLLVGFWFDGGLFILSTAATFWILLELGAAKLPQTKVVPS